MWFIALVALAAICFSSTLIYDVLPVHHVKKQRRIDRIQSMIRNDRRRMM